MCAITSWTRQPSQSLGIAHSSALRLLATFSTSSRSALNASTPRSLMTLERTTRQMHDVLRRVSAFGCVPGWPMSSQRATSTRTRSNSNSGSFDIVSIMPPTSLAAPMATTAARFVSSSLTSMALARMQSSSSSGPGVGVDHAARIATQIVSLR